MSLVLTLLSLYILEVTLDHDPKTGESGIDSLDVPLPVSTVVGCGSVSTWSRQQ